MKIRLAADILKLVGKEIVIRRGMRYIPYRYLPYVRTAFVILDVVMIGRKIYLAIPRKQVPGMDQAGSPDLSSPLENGQGRKIKLIP